MPFWSEGVGMKNQPTHKQTKICDSFLLIIKKIAYESKYMKRRG